MLLGYIVSLDEFGQPIRSDGLALTVADWVSVGYTPEAAARYVAEFDAGVDHSPAPTLATARYVPYGVDSQGGATWQDYYSKRVMPDGFWPITSERGYQHRNGSIGLPGDDEWQQTVAAAYAKSSGAFSSFSQTIREAAPGILFVLSVGTMANLLIGQIATELATTAAAAGTPMPAVEVLTSAEAIVNDAMISASQQAAFDAAAAGASESQILQAMQKAADAVLRNAAADFVGPPEPSWLKPIAPQDFVGPLQPSASAMPPWQIPGVPAIPTGAASAAAALLKALTGATSATAPRPVTTPPYIPGVAGPPIDTTAPNPQSIQAMLPWLAIAAFGVVALKGK